MLFPLLLLAGGAVAILTVVFTREVVPNHQPDLPPSPGSSGYKLVDAILPELKKAAISSGIPLGLLVGWIAKESGGKLSDHTSLDERGYFQLMPDESKGLGLDHERLSTDPVYSINAGLLLIGKYMALAAKYGIAPPGSSYFFRLVKMIHTVGNGDVATIVNGAKAAGMTGSWDDLEKYALSGDAHTKHSPAKWMPFIDSIYSVGRPFGFGSETSTTLVGAGFTDIPDPLSLLPKYRRG